MLAYLLGAAALLLAFTVGYGLAVHRLTGRIEAMHAAMTATRTDDGSHRCEVADEHLAGWLASRFHLPHRRAAA